MEKYKEQPKYFKNAELTKLYGVSDKAIRNWIEKAEQGKVELELVIEDGKTYIKDSFQNSHLLESLTEKGKKYRNRRAYKEVIPTSAFYELYSQEQIIDIINSLEKYREAPTQYRYIGKGAGYWDAYLRKLYDIKNSYVTATVELIKLDEAYLALLFERYAHINIVDIGVGNGLSIKELLAFVKGTGKLKKYIGIDISKDLLDRTERNINQWFNGTIIIEKYVKDITCERFAQVVSNDSYDKDAACTLNLFLFLGGTMTNNREPDQMIRTIRDSMGSEDLLITTHKLDSEKSRGFFDFDVPNDRSLLSFHDRYTLDLLSIDRSFYDVEQLFDEQSKCRYIRVRLKVTVSIKFKVHNFYKEVEIKKGETILLVRMWHFSERDIVKILNDNGMTLLRSAKTYNQEYLLVAAKVSSDSN